MNPKNAVWEPPGRQSAKAWRVGGRSVCTRLVFQPAENFLHYSLMSWRFICLLWMKRLKMTDVRFLGETARLRMVTLLCLALVLPACFATRSLNRTIDRAMHPA